MCFGCVGCVLNVIMIFWCVLRCLGVFFDVLGSFFDVLGCVFDVLGCICDVFRCVSVFFGVLRYVGVCF